MNPKQKLTVSVFLAAVLMIAVFAVLDFTSTDEPTVSVYSLYSLLVVTLVVLFMLFMALKNQRDTGLGISSKM